MLNSFIVCFEYDVKFASDSFGYWADNYNYNKLETLLLVKV